MDHKELLLLKSDVAILLNTAKMSYTNETWGAWPQLVTNYEKYRAKAVSMGVIDRSFSMIVAVPEDEQPASGWGGGSPAEEGKLTEVISAAEGLLVRLEMMTNNASPQSKAQGDPVKVIQSLCEAFHKIAIQLRRRHEGRETLDVSDEYDVQDLMHALLLQHFKDIRSEEWTPSYAGKATRMDFLLKMEQIVFELKHTGKRLKDKDIGEQLLIDIEHYKKSPDCKTLICFVYDPDARIANPRGLENDLARKDGAFSAVVFIYPHQ